MPNQPNQTNQTTNQDNDPIGCKDLYCKDIEHEDHAIPQQFYCHEWIELPAVGQITFCDGCQSHIEIKEFSHFAYSPIDLETM